MVAMCWLSAVIGWSSFPFSSILEKAYDCDPAFFLSALRTLTASCCGDLRCSAVSLPLNARNFVWLAGVPPAINWAVKKIKSF